MHFSFLSPENLLVENAGGVMTIGINRPEKRNAVNPETAQELVRAFHQFEEEKDTFVAVLHGTGNYDLLCSCLLFFLIGHIKDSNGSIQLYSACRP